MEKVLILTCSTGEGHNSAARAIETILNNKKVFCEIKDPISFESEKMKERVSALYNDTIRRAPSLFGAMYKIGDAYSSLKLPSPIYWANAHYADALKKYILDNRFDAVISTHLYGMEALTAIRKDPDFKVPCFGVLTDYVCIPFIAETDLTGVFAPMEDIKDCLVQKGVPEEKIYVSGIPVSDSFRNAPNREDARKMLGIDGDKHVFLIMTGGVGCENMEKLCRKLLDSIDASCMVLVMTGKNESLKARLDSRYADNLSYRSVSFTRDVACYMAASDVLLTKPGGLSSTEAAVANIPIVHIHAIPGCETYNEELFSSLGMSMSAKNDEEAVSKSLTLAYDREKADAMREMQRRFSHPDAAERIAEEVERQCSIQS